VVAYCKAGWRFSDPAVWSNPIPGNHGHPVTEPIPVFLAGGSRRVGFGEVRPDVVHTVDVAPAVGEVIGLPVPVRRLRRDVASLGLTALDDPGL
jgi:hypothetical protein